MPYLLLVALLSVTISTAMAQTASVYHAPEKTPPGVMPIYHAPEKTPPGVMPIYHQPVATPPIGRLPIKTPVTGKPPVGTLGMSYPGGVPGGPLHSGPITGPAGGTGTMQPLTK